MLCIAPLFSNAQIITTVAGDGNQGYSGDGGQATAAELNYPCSLTVDKLGNFYIADENNNCIRKVAPSGIITTYAGIGVLAFSGDGGPATAAEIAAPAGVCSDTSGNIYIADYYNNRIRRVNTSGIINTIAGDGHGGYSGDGGPATLAELNYPVGVAVDVSGNVYIADYNNYRIRMVNTSGTISTIAGNGYAGFYGDGGPATAAEIMTSGVSVDKNGDLFITDYGRIRKVTSGVISLFAGNGAPGFSGDGGLATSAECELNIPGPSAPINEVEYASGNVFIADKRNNRIRIVNASGIIGTFAVNGIQSYSGDGGVATSAEIGSPSGVAMDSYGNLFIADTYNNRIRKVSSISTSVVTMQLNSVIICPNPFTSTFTIQLKSVQNVKIYNVTGQLVFSSRMPAGSDRVDLSGQPAGVYFLSVGDSSQKLIKY